MKIYCISDTHFFHKNMVKFENRPEDFTNQIVHSWNSMVKESDLVIHLGDVIFGPDKGNALTLIMKRLNGRKILCRGNHDSYPEAAWGDWEWFMARGFNFVCDHFVYQDLAFSHAPLTPLPVQSPQNFGQEVRLNIHGHFHRGATRLPQAGQETTFTDKYYNYQYYQANKEKYKLVQIEDELRPFSLEEILLWP